jgi:hypothetical protein
VAGLGQEPAHTPPETEILVSLDDVSQPGNTVISWKGAATWKVTPEAELQYAPRMDDGQWSAFSHQTNQPLRESNAFLSTANHTLFDLNRSLYRDRAGERVRAAVSSMKATEDLEDVVQEMLRELTEPGVVFDLCVITILDQEAGIRRVLGIEDENARPTPVVDAPFTHGILSLQTQSKDGFSEEDVAFVGEFARVISLGYARYLDFQNLEKQNIKLQREQVLGRRGQGQVMQSSQDIKPVVEAVNRELIGLGLSLRFATIGIYVSQTETEIWATGHDGHAMEPFTIEHHEIPSREAQRRGDDYYHIAVEGEEAKKHIRQMVAEDHPLWIDMPEDQWPDIWAEYDEFFKGGRIRLVTEEGVTQDYLMLIKRFGEVFGYAHSRYRELQQKEAQNRRLAVEASVQRLRAEVQSMDEVSDFEHILSLLTGGFEAVDLRFDGCEISGG